MKARSALQWLSAILAFAVVVAYSLVVNATLKDSPLQLLGCIEGSKAWAAWTCRQVLFHTGFSAEEVRELNAEAGSLYAVAMKDPKEAEEALKLFLARGVDIDAKHVKAMDWTALHTLASEGDPTRVALLLKYGARANVRDARGKTPLDVARDMQQRYPGAASGREEAIRLLEEAERKEAEQK